MKSTTSDCDLLAETVARLVSTHSPLSDLDRIVQSEVGHDPAVWQRLVQLGAPALLVPEEVGGMGRAMAEAIAVATALGRNLVSGPFLSSSIGATVLLASISPDPRCDGMLAQLAGGDVLAASVDATNSAVRIRPGQTGGWTIDGEVTLALGVDSADVLIVHTDEVVLAIDAGSAQRVPTPMADQTRRMATVAFDHVDVPGESVLATGETAADAVRRARLAFGLGVAADCVGGAEAVLSMAIEYAKTRRQFGRPIGSFQAIKHKLADMHIFVQSAKAITAEAGEAWARSGSAPLEVVTRAAMSHATAAYVSVAGDAIQVHGGIGFTWEHPCHRYLKRAWLNQALIGGPTAALTSFADAVIDRALRSS